MKGLRTFTRLLPIVGLLWVYLFLRWHDIAAHFPYFIDEIHHVRRARAVWAFNDLHTSTTPSKFLLYYWLGAFHLPQFPDLWLVRVPGALASILGAASTFALARLLFNRRAAFLALGIVTVFPFLLFYERMSLTDPLAGTLTVMMTWWSVVVARHPSKRNATILAIVFCLMWAAKILTLPMIVVPFLAVGLLGARPVTLDRPMKQEIMRIWRDYRPAIVRASVIIIVVWGTIFGFYQIRKVLDPDTRAIVDDYLYEGATSGGNKLMTSLERASEALRKLWGPLVLGVLLLPYVWWRRWRVALFLLGGILPMWVLIILVAGQLNSRYLSIVGHLCAVLIAGAAAMIIDERRLGIGRWVPTGLLIIWVFGFGLPFARTAMQDPIELDLPDRDKSEYFRNYTGYALPDAFAYVVEHNILGHDEPVIVTSFVRVCEFAPYHVPAHYRDDLNLICNPPDIDRFENRYLILNQALETHPSVYLIVEQYETPDESLMLDPALVIGVIEGPLQTYRRPHDGVPVEVYTVTR